MISQYVRGVKILLNHGLFLMVKTVFILNGPNLNLLGQREPDVYGSISLADIERDCLKLAGEIDISVDFRQSNHEGRLVDWIQEAGNSNAGIILNAGAYTHTSVAIHDAVRAISLPVIELHLSNIHAREEFRHKSFISPVASGVIFGFGADGYLLAIRAVSTMLSGKPD